MSQENRINDALHVLGEELRLGMITVEEYRGRRRLLLEGWGERDVTTSPTGMKRGTQPSASSRTAPNPAATARAAPPVVAAKSARAWWIGGALLALALGAVSFALGVQRPPADASRAELRALSSAVAEFTQRNRWEAADLDRLAQHWSALPVELHEQARREPAVKSLRHELNQNIQAERQALAADAAPTERRARLARLEQLAYLLDGPAQ